MRNNILHVTTGVDKVNKIKFWIGMGIATIFGLIMMVREWISPSDEPDYSPTIPTDFSK